MEREPQSGGGKSLQKTSQLPYRNSFSRSSWIIKAIQQNIDNFFLVAYIGEKQKEHLGENLQKEEKEKRKSSKEMRETEREESRRDKIHFVTKDLQGKQKTL